MFKVSNLCCGGKCKALLLVLRPRKESAGHDLRPEFRKSDALLWVDAEDALYNLVELVRNGKYGLEKVGVCKVCREGLVTQVGLLPGVASCCKVDKDDAERPDIVRCSVIGGELVAKATLAL